MDNKKIVLDKDNEKFIQDAFQEWLDSGEKKTAKSFSEIEKFNPYHGPDGRFTTAGGATSFNLWSRRKTGETPAMFNIEGLGNDGKDLFQSKQQQAAVAREKERTASSANDGSDFGLTPEQHKELERKLNGSRFGKVADEYRKELGMSDDEYEKYKTKYKSEERTKQIREEVRNKKAAEEEQKRQETQQRLNDEFPGLNKEAIQRANNNSMLGTTGDVMAKNALAHLDSFDKQFSSSDLSEEQKKILAERREGYKQLVTEYTNDQIARTADNVSWAVAGPANYNVRRSQKKMEAQMNKAEQYQEKMEKYRKNTEKMLKGSESEESQIDYWRKGKNKYGETISSDDPLAEKKLQAKLDYMTESQEKMKAANKYYKKNGTMDGFEGYSEKVNSDINRAMEDLKQRSPYLADKPFQSYSLTNNNAEIKRTKQRLEELQRNKQKTAETKENGGSGVTRSFNGGTVTRNAEANRLQISFDDIPDASMRSKLKSNGWRWSPKNKVWQRQLTDNAERSALSLLEGLEKSYPYEKEDTFRILKSDDDKRLVFGWAQVATRANGEVIQDWQDDIVTPEELEKAAYKYVLDFRDGGEEHQRGLRKKCRMVESVVFTEEKLNAMGIPSGTVPLGWWIGFYVDDDDAWKKIKDGTYTQFSVEGTGQRRKIDDIETRMRKSAADGAKTFYEIEKFNPYHGYHGYFSTAANSTSFTYSPGKSKAHDNAIAREKERMRSSVNVGDSIERRGSTVKVLNVDEKNNLALVQLTGGKEFGTRKIGDKFNTKLDTLKNEKKNSLSTGKVEAVEIDFGNGSKISYRQNGEFITDITGGPPKRTNGMTLDQIVDRAKQLGHKVTTYDSKQLSEYDSNRKTEREKTRRELDYNDVRDRSKLTYRSPGRGWKGH